MSLKGACIATNLVGADLKSVVMTVDGPLPQNNNGIQNFRRL